MLGAEATQGFCLVLHELAANAAKYGALAQPRLHPLGRVAIHWQVRDGWLWLRWQESGGPATLPPERRGFGLRIIEQTVQGQLHGRLERRWTAEGLVCEIEIPHGPMALRTAPPLAAE
jgi:two-component sensor histidine kinase